METLVDQCLTRTPVVYTLAGERATTVNSRRAIHRVPLGITGDSDDNVTLTFTGMNTLGKDISLLDTHISELTPPDHRRRQHPHHRARTLRRPLLPGHHH